MNSRALAIFLPALLLWPVCITAGAVIYVDADAPIGGEGSSWAVALKYLQDALAVADANDEIRVAQGTYLPDRSIADPNGSGNRNATFHLINGVSIRGGYAGLGEPDPDARDVENYVTILSGDLAGDDGADFLNNDENSYHVVTGSNGNETAVLDGFTIAGGHADGGDEYSNGGGMYNNHGSPTLIDCLFRGNMAAGEWWCGGGGMYNGYGSPILIDCVFSGNAAAGELCGGGGMYNGDGSPTLINCIFRDNTVMSMYFGGGGMCSYSGSPVLTKCIFSGNVAEPGGGGGMYCTDIFDSPKLTDCIFAGNRTGSNGGGLTNYSLNMTLVNCIFIGNSAGSTGGGLHNQRWDGYVTLTNCMVIGNTAQGRNGGGMFSEHTLQMATNCTFSGNSAGLRGGGIYCVMANDGGYQEITTLANCILRGNSAEEGPEIALYSHEIYVSHCNVQGGKADVYIVNEDPEPYLTWDDASNIDVDPLFVDADNDDCHLRWSSPCINAGDPSGDYAGLVDMDGEPRVMGGRVDMGADEVGEKQGDFTRDGIINLRDFSVFSQSWPDSASSENWNLLCDLYEDEQIDALDMAEFVNGWLWQADWHESQSDKNSWPPGGPM